MDAGEVTDITGIIYMGANLATGTSSHIDTFKV
jgi:hypothetical protein